MRYIFLLLLLIGCTKEPEFITTGKFEGSYSGRLEVWCDSFPYHKTKEDVIDIASFDGERLSVHSSLGTAYGYNGYSTYRTSLEYLDETDCGLEVFVYLQVSGELIGDSLSERGTLVATRGSKKYSGKYKFNGKR